VQLLNGLGETAIRDVGVDGAMEGSFVYLGDKDAMCESDAAQMANLQAFLPPTASTGCRHTTDD
jgi:hypothetical protein